jgi:titin
LYNLIFAFLVSNLDVPDAPEGPVEFSDITKDSVTLSWKPPTKDGGSEVTSYVIEQRDTRRSTWTKAGTVNGTTTSYTATRLIEDNEYIFRITAENKEGPSAVLESSPVKPCRPKGPFKNYYVLFSFISF